MIVDLEVGPQYSSDNPFTARMRSEHSWYRATPLRPSPREAVQHAGEAREVEAAGAGI